MVRRVTFAVPGDLATPTGGYVYDRRIVAELEKLGWEVGVLDLGDGFPRPSAAQRAQAERKLAAIPAGRLIVIDGLAFGVLADAARSLQQTHHLIALVHHPLAFETGLPEREAAEFCASERRALSFAHHVVATSETTARLLRTEFAVPDKDLSVVRPGTDRVASTMRSRDSEVTLLAVGSIVSRKGYDVLIAALGRISDRPWRLVIAGDATRSPATAEALEALIADLKLIDRVKIIGAVAAERLSELYADADVFVLASRYEGYGMAFAEAIAHGLPVIGTTAGAIPEAVPSTAGVLVPPNDTEGLALALQRLLDDPAERARLARAARTAAVKLPTWPEAGRQFSHVLDAVA